jgi:ThiF family
MPKLHRYALVGAGGTGSILLPILARYLRSHHADDDWLLAVIDGDQVEGHNLSRQLFHEPDINTMKATAAAARTRDPRVLAITEFIADDNIERILVEGTTILIAADNYTVRGRIERHVLSLENGVVINGGNEAATGSCQIWVRENGKNVTPPLSFLHDEIHSGGHDPASLSCVELAALPGGEQTIVANMASALWMLTALHKVLTGDIRWNDLQWDLVPGLIEAVDTSPRKGWIQ